MAQESNHKKHKMAAVLVKGGAVVSKNTNTEVAGQHAERRALKHPCIGGATVYVARAGGKMSKPCRTCRAALKQCGVSRMVYADWDGSLKMESV